MMFCLGETAALGQERAENKLEDVIDQLLLETGYVSGDRQLRRRYFKVAVASIKVAITSSKWRRQFKVAITSSNRRRQF